MKQIFKVVAQQESMTVTKQDGSMLKKCFLVLQEIGNKYENSYVCALLGNDAESRFYKDELVVASLRFQHYEYQDKFYNEITVQEILKLK